MKRPYPYGAPPPYGGYEAPFGYEDPGMNGHGVGDPSAPYIGPFHLRLQEVLSEIAGKHFSSTKCANMEQLCTTLEEAYWDYKDLYVADNPDVFPPLTFKEFVEQLFAEGRAEQPPFCNFRSSPREMADWYLKYKRTLSSYGVIILDSSLKKCVMVRGVGTSLWGFPKGKAKFVPKARQQKEGTEAEEANGSTLDMVRETARECAVREAFEELGIDLNERIDEKLTLEWHQGKRKAIFFIVPNMPRGTPFAPQLRNEIEEIDWKPVAYIPDYNLHYSGLAEKLHKWIADYKPPKGENANSEKDGNAASQTEGDEDEVRPGHAEGQDAYSGIAFKLRRIKDGCKRCPICGMWFMPGRKLHMLRHLKTCAEEELKQLEGPPPTQQIQSSQAQMVPSPSGPQHALAPVPAQQPHSFDAQTAAPPPSFHPPPEAGPQWNVSPPPTAQQPGPPPQASYPPPPSVGPPQYAPGPQPAPQPASALQVLQRALQKAVGDRIAAQQAASHQPSPPQPSFIPSPPPSFSQVPPQPQPQPQPQFQPHPQPYTHTQPQMPPPQPWMQPPPQHPPPPQYMHLPPQQPPPEQMFHPPPHHQPAFQPPHHFLPQQPPPSQLQPGGFPPPAQPQFPGPQQIPPPGGPQPMQPQPAQVGQTRNQILESLQALLRGPQ